MEIIVSKIVYLLSINFGNEIASHVVNLGKKSIFHHNVLTLKRPTIYKSVKIIYDFIHSESLEAR